MYLIMKLPIRLALFAAVLAAPLVARATTVLPPSDDELVARAAVIGLATVQRVDVAFNPYGQVMTHAELLIEQGIRGAGPGEFVVMEYPGGVLPNGLKSTVPGAPTVKVGDRVFVYLSAAPTDATRLRPIGLRYGVLNVVRDAKGQLRASRSVDGLSFVDHEQKPLADTIFEVRNVKVSSLVDDAQQRMRRLHIDAGAALGKSPAINAVRVQK
jgi:hypothetical protein